MSISTLRYLAQAVRSDFPYRDLPLVHSIEITGSVQMLALLPISQYRPRDVSAQHNVIPRFGRRAPVRLAVDDTFNKALLWQQVKLDAKPNVIQQQENRALIHNSAAHCDLRVISPAALGNFVAPGAIIPVETDQPRTGIDIQLLRYIGVAPKKAPTRRKVK